MTMTCLPWITIINMYLSQGVFSSFESNGHIF